MARSRMIGAAAFKRAIDRNPRAVAKHAKNFLQRGISEYQRGVRQSPWKVGQSGGGAPVRTGALRDSHLPPQFEFGRLRAWIGPDPSRTEIQSGRMKGESYAPLVHGGTRYMKARPWLDWVKKEKEDAIMGHARRFLTDVTEDLAN